MNNTEKINLAENPKEEGNYFELFNLPKFKKIIFPLAIIALLLLIKQFIINNFSYIHQVNNGLGSLLDSYNNVHDAPVWANTINMLIEILIILVLLCWEAVTEEKYDKIKIILLLGLPSIAVTLISTYSDLYESGKGSAFYAVYSILGYLSFYSLYGLLRGKILYGKKLSFTGYLIGMFVIVSIHTLYQKIASVLLMNEVFSPVYKYGMTLTGIFIPLTVFYFFFVIDAGFSFKNFLKMPSISLLNKEQFTAHFLLLFTSLLALHFYFTENFSMYWFNDIDFTNWSFLFNLYIILINIFKIAFVYLLFSQLLLVQLGALGRRPLWIYLLSFVPIVNIAPLMFVYRKSAAFTNTEDFIIQDRDERNRSSLQLFILFSLVVYAIYKYVRLDVTSENSILILGTIILMYSLILYLRIGIWITLGLLGIAVVVFLFQDIPTGLYYFSVASYAAIGFYNLHIALFWKVEESMESTENIESVNNEDLLGTE